MSRTVVATERQVMLYIAYTCGYRAAGYATLVATERQVMLYVAYTCRYRAAGYAVCRVYRSLQSGRLCDIGRYRAAGYAVCRVHWFTSLTSDINYLIELTRIHLSFIRAHEIGAEV